MDISPVCDWYHQWRWPNVMFHSTFIEFRRSALRRRFHWGSIQKDRNHWSLLLWDLTVLSFWGGAWHIIVPHFQFCFWHNAWSDLGSLVRARLRLKQTLVFYAEMWFKQFGNAQSESENDGQVNRHDTPVPPQRLSWVKKSTLWIYVGGYFWEAVKDKYIYKMYKGHV